MLSVTRRVLLTGAAGMLVLSRASRGIAAEATGLADLKRFLGKWKGEGEGEPGHSQVERSYEATPGDNFILVHNTSTYAPQEKNPKGETHTDVGYVSFDKARKKFVLRQFHLNEAFVNQYVSAGFIGDEAIFESEAIENIPAGWRARETYRFSGADAFEEIFELSEPGKDTWSLYAHNKMKRA